MSQNSSIEWTEATWNPVRGCVKVSPGCAHCYAETFAERFRGVKGHPYEQGFDLLHVPSKLDEPLRRKKPTTYFVNSMSDLFQDGVNDLFISHVFAVMALTPQHTYQVLTKRAQRMRDYLHEMTTDPDAFCFAWAREYQRDDRQPTPRLTNETWPLPNVWLGVSVENQHFADERIPLLLQTPAAVRFISAEPLLEAVDLRLNDEFPSADGGCYEDARHGVRWVIVGGESGPGARPFDVAWARSIVQQCKDAGVACFVKQVGLYPWDSEYPGPNGEIETHWKLRDKKGGDPAEWPEDLRVREFPQVNR